MRSISFLLFSLLHLVNGCPKELTSLCECEQRVSGLDVSCTDKKLSVVMRAVRKSNFAIARLTVRDAGVGSLDGVDLGSTVIRVLDLSHNQITKIAHGAFSGQEDVLVDLRLANNSLSTVPQFGSLPKLRALNLNGNQLQDVKEGSLAKLTSLKQLRLERNKICKLSNNALAETKGTLELLDLSENCLDEVPAQNLRNSGRLMYVDLSSNRIEKVSNMQFMNLPKLKEVRLSDNQITRVSPLAFMNVPSLQFLYLRNNNIRKLEPNRFQGFRKLQVLDLSGNMLRFVPTSSFREVPSLTQVFLDDNSIKFIETLAFTNNPKLELISAQNNGMMNVYRNAFDSLDNMAVLLLGNNSLTRIDRGVFSGLPNLQQLNLGNNSITTIVNSAFNSVPKLTTLDLGHNSLTTLPKSSLAKLSQLFWLDLSDNDIQSFLPDTFQKKIANILLHNNPLECDSSMDWLVKYLVKNNVRTFLPYQEEVVCTGPAAYKGTRLKELMIRRANETFVNNLRTIGINAHRGGAGGSSNPLLGNLLPSVGRLPGLSKGIPGLTSAVPYLGAITQAIPALGGVPGLNLLPMNRLGANGLDRAITDFTGPLNRFATAGKPSDQDVSDFLGTIPNLVTNLPGIGNIDLRKIPPELIRHVMNGGSIPGVPRASIDRLLQTHMLRMAEAAKRARQGHVDAATTAALPPLSEVPSELMQNVLRGETLPGLTPEQTNDIKLYYTQGTPVQANGPTGIDGSSGKQLIQGVSAGELLRFLPAGYDLTKLPPSVLEAISGGDPFDIDSLPNDLLLSLKTNHPQLFQRETPKTKETLEEILEKLPPLSSSRAGGNGKTFRPYNIDDLDRQTVPTPHSKNTARTIGIITALGLGLVGAATIVVIGIMCYRQKHGNEFEEEDSSSTDDGGLGAPTSAKDKTHINYAHLKASSSEMPLTSTLKRPDVRLPSLMSEADLLSQFQPSVHHEMHAVNVDPYAMSRSTPKVTVSNPMPMPTSSQFGDFFYTKRTGI